MWSQPPIGEQAEQPSNGREQLPDNPPQPSAGQPPYGPPPYGTGGYGPPPVKRRNGFANAGIILAVLISILSLIFSIIGLDKLKTLAADAKAFSSAGIGVPLPAGIGTAVDPGCVTAAAVGRHVTSTLNADNAAINRDQTNPPAELADLQRLVTDLQSLQRQMTTAQAQATHQSVKTGISAMISDLKTFSSGLQAVENGDLSRVSQLPTVANNVKSDGRKIATTCTSVSR